MPIFHDIPLSFVFFGKNHSVSFWKVIETYWFIRIHIRKRKLLTHFKSPWGVVEGGFLPLIGTCLMMCGTLVFINKISSLEKTGPMVGFTWVGCPNVGCPDVLTLAWGGVWWTCTWWGPKMGAKGGSFSQSLYRSFRFRRFIQILWLYYCGYFKNYLRLFIVRVIILSSGVDLLLIFTNKNLPWTQKLNCKVSSMLGC